MSTTTNRKTPQSTTTTSHKKKNSASMPNVTGAKPFETSTSRASKQRTRTRQGAVNTDGSGRGTTMNATNQLFESIRDTLIKRLETARDSKTPLPIWRKPWTELFPKNILTGETYSGFNILAFTFASEVCEYTSPYFITYKQCALYNQKHGTNLHVRKGEKHIKGVRYGDKWIPKDWEHIGGGQYQSARHGDIKSEQHVTQSWAKIIQVFNAEQIENCPAEFLPTAIETVPQYDHIQSFVDKTRANIRPAASAFFTPTLDQIGMPPLHLFKTEEDYWATLLHELVHWTGHETRLERDLKGRAGSIAYSKEELVAEMGSAFLCGYFGLTAELQHASYIDNYIQILKNDLSAVRWAATRATDAFNYLHDSITEADRVAA